MTILVDARESVCEHLKKPAKFAIPRDASGDSQPQLRPRRDDSGKVATDYCTTRVKLVLCVNLADPELKVPVTVRA
jgi:hypothetical protein